ncbi:fer-1-like protein 4 [Hippocampus comes]|uniref:fer-1-like protein 4 n=1 Tax=Hippocampus comes TaxID=109280 RepID=UPI00094E1ED7|nr:PREDICTED: fer-1-like protein 4 [Hippocampus comes]
MLSRLERELEREARQLGRDLIRGQGDHDDYDDYDDDDEDDLLDMEMSDIVFTPLMSRSRPLSRHVAAATPRVQSFQVNVNILEAQKLAGVNINPAVFIRVGDQKKHTATQKSTNCPFYNENFQFEFHETPEVLFDKVIEIKVYHRRTLPFLTSHVGTFKIDIATVFHEPDHRFYEKWAPLTDPADTRSGAKGYVKATLSVLMKGEALNAGLPPATSGANDDIDKSVRPHFSTPEASFTKQPDIRDHDPSKSLKKAQQVRRHFGSKRTFSVQFSNFYGSFKILKYLENSAPQGSFK